MENKGEFPGGEITINTKIFAIQKKKSCEELIS